MRKDDRKHLLTRPLPSPAPRSSVSTVVVALKVILRQADLDASFTGGLGSFKLYVLVAHALRAAAGGDGRVAKCSAQQRWRRRRGHAGMTGTARRWPPVSARGQSTSMLMLLLEMCGYQELWPVTPVERRGAMAALCPPHIFSQTTRLLYE